MVDATRYVIYAQDLRRMLAGEEHKTENPMQQRFWITSCLCTAARSCITSMHLHGMPPPLLVSVVASVCSFCCLHQQAWLKPAIPLARPFGTFGTFGTPLPHYSLASTPCCFVHASPCAPSASLTGHMLPAPPIPCCLAAHTFPQPACRRDAPDFTKTSQDGYTFDTYWEGRMIAKDVIKGHAEAKRSAQGATKERSGRNNRHFHDSMDHEEVLASFHAT